MRCIVFKAGGGEGDWGRASGRMSRKKERLLQEDGDAERGGCTRVPTVHGETNWWVMI